MEAAEVRSRQADDDEAAAPVQRFVVIVGEPADGGSAFRVDDPARLLRVWAMLEGTFEQLKGTTLPPEGMPALQRQLQLIRSRFLTDSSPPSSWPRVRCRCWCPATTWPRARTFCRHGRNRLRLRA